LSAAPSEAQWGFSSAKEKASSARDYIATVAAEEVFGSIANKASKAFRRQVWALCGPWNR
jgi:hypothetical protein